MRNYGAMVLLIAVLTAAGLKYSPRTSEPEKKSGPTAVADAKASAATPDGLRTRSNPAPTTECTCLPPDDGEQEYLIVTLPDPLVSSSGYRFDSLVDALQRAMETKHYVLDSYCYPWRSGVKPLEPAAPRERLGFTFALETALWKNDAHLHWTAPPERKERAFPLYPDKPGFLVFRQTNESSPVKRLVMFLVGETATKGIDKNTLRSSLNWLKEHKGCGKDKPIRVLGPFFSGTQTSLIDAINAWHKPGGEPLCFHIISGSATKIRGSEFRNKFHKEISVQFETTVHAEIVLKMEMMKFLKVTENGPERVAILEESNTKFGQPPPPPSWPDTNKQDKKKPSGHHVHLPFPLHISEVRAAYSRAQKEAGAPQASLPSFSGTLHLPQTEGPDPTDTEPSLTPITTAAVMEQVLSQILTTLSREQYKYVVILATDLKDKIFLATQIRTYCPDVQLLLSGSDLMYGHPDNRYYFQGALVASTYPLHSKNQVWSYPFKGGDWRLLLPDEECQGIYNAAIALLACDKKPNSLDYLLEYGPPFDKDPATCRRPPVWISILGQNGPHPLRGAMPSAPAEESCFSLERNEWVDCENHVYTANTDGDQTLEASPFEPQYTGYWVWSCFGVFFFCVLLCHWSLRSFRKAIQPAGSWASIFYLIFCLAALAVVVCYVLVIIDVVPLRWFFTSHDAHLFAERASDIAGGVTPILPIVFLSMAIFCLAYYQLDRCRLHAEARLEAPFPDLRSEPMQGLQKHDRKLDNFLVSPLKEIFVRRWNTTYPALLILLFIFYNVRRSYVPSVEGTFHDRLLFLSFAGFTLLLAYVFQQSRLLWDMMHDLLREIAKLPLANAFGRLPMSVTDTFGPYLSSPSPGKTSQEELPLQQLRAVAVNYGCVRELLQKIFHLSASGPDHDLAELDRALWYHPVTKARCAYLSFLLSNHFWLEADATEVRVRKLLPQEHFTRAARACMRVLNACWLHLTAHEGHSDPEADDAKGKAAEEAVDPYLERLCNLAGIADAEGKKALQTWLQMAEDFAAIQITAYVSQFFVQLRRLALSLTWAPVLAVLAIVSYPLHPQRLLLTVAGGIVVLLMGYAFYTLVHIELDEVVSRIRKGTPQRLDLSWEFVRHLALYIVPVLGVLAAASPDLSNVLHSLLDPIYQVMK